MLTFFCLYPSSDREKWDYIGYLFLQYVWAICVRRICRNWRDPLYESYICCDNRPLLRTVAILFMRLEVCLEFATSDSGLLVVFRRGPPAMQEVKSIRLHISFIVVDSLPISRTRIK